MKSAVLTGIVVLVQVLASAAIGTMVRIYNYPGITQVYFWSVCIVLIFLSAGLIYRQQSDIE